jgi:hypothetical protein
VILVLSLVCCLNRSLMREKGVRIEDVYSRIDSSWFRLAAVIELSSFS